MGRWINKGSGFRPRRFRTKGTVRERSVEIWYKRSHDVDKRPIVAKKNSAPRNQGGRQVHVEDIRKLSATEM